MNVDEDFICEHAMPKPWATCMECMYLPAEERPTPPRVAEAKKSASRGSSPSKSALPKTEKDPWPPLVGNKDLSYPVYDIDLHIEGEGNDWLAGEHGFPKELRPGGWIYLRHDGKLGARGRVRGIGWRNDRPQHTGDLTETWDAGPTLEIDPNSWERVDHDLGDLAETQRQGYRYLITHSDGTITHLSATDKVPDEIQPDEPVVAKRYKLLNEQGRQISSWTPGTIGGNGKDNIWGNLDCRAALKALENDKGYRNTRVFFASPDVATAAGYRPCGTCRPNEYKVWLASQD